MEKNRTETEASTNRPHFVTKVVLFLLCAVVILQFALIASCFASLKDLSNKFQALAKGKTSGISFLRSEDYELARRRSKRETEKENVSTTLIKLQKLEGR